MTCNLINKIEEILGPNYDDLMSYALGRSSWRSIQLSKSHLMINEQLGTKVIDSSQTILDGIHSLRKYFEKDKYFSQFL